MNTNEHQSTDPDRGFFYGWVVVGISFTTEFVASGFVMYAFAVVLTQLADEFSGGDRTPILTMQMLAYLVILPLTPYIGRLAGRGWLRPMMAGGAILMGLGFLAFSRAQELWQVALCFAALISVGASTLSGIPPTTLIINWFERRRATALGVTQLGASLAGVIMTPVVAALVQSRGGWRGAYEVLGIVALCLAPVVWLLVVGRPEDRGLQPDGVPLERDEMGRATATAAAEQAKPFRTVEALRQPNLWRIGLAMGLAFMATGVLVSHVVAYGTDAGFSDQSAAFMASMVAAGAALGKLVFGWLCDRVGPARAFMLGLSIQATGFAALLGADSYELLVGVLFLSGLGGGGTYPLSNALLADAFGRDDFAPMSGLMYVISTPPGLVGPVVAARIYDTSGNYDMAFLMCVAALVSAVFLVRSVRTHDAVVTLT